MNNVWRRVIGFIRGENRQPIPQPPSVLLNDEPEIVVPELTVEEVQDSLAKAVPPLLIDIREPYEWRLVRIPNTCHIPMNEVPDHLDKLPRDRPVVIFCAHGSRSYSVAAWLIEQGVNASSMAGGITQWASRGGAVEQGE